MKKDYDDFMKNFRNNKQTMKLKSIIEITLTLILMISIFIVNINFENIYNLDHEVLIKVQKYFYSFAANPFSTFITNNFFYALFKGYSMNSLLSFLYFSFSPFFAFKISIIYNFGLVFTEAINILLYQQVRPFWAFPDIKSQTCTEQLSGSSDITFLFLLLTLVLVFNFIKFKIFSIKLSFLLGVLGAILTLVQIFYNYVQGRSFLTQIVSGIIWAFIAYIFVKICDDRINSLTFKLGFINRKSKKWKIYILCYVLIFYFFLLLFLNSYDNDTLISPNYAHNYFQKCGFDPQFINNCLINTHNTVLNILAIPLMSFGSSFIYSNFVNNWFDTSLIKRILRGIIVYILMFSILYLQVIFQNYFVSLLSNMIISGIIPLLIAYTVCFYLLPLIFNKISLFNQVNERVLKMKEEPFISFDDNLILND